MTIISVLALLNVRALRQLLKSTSIDLLPKNSPPSDERAPVRHRKLFRWLLARIGRSRSPAATLRNADFLKVRPSACRKHVFCGDGGHMQ